MTTTERAGAPSPGLDPVYAAALRQALVDQVEQVVGAGTVRPSIHPPNRTPAARWAPLLAVTAVTAVIAILAVGAGVVAVHRSRTTAPATSSAGGPVPWSAAGGHPATASVPLPVGLRATPGLRECVSDDFRLRSGSSEAEAPPIIRKWMVTTYTLVSVASSPCSSWALSAGLVDSRGAPLPEDGGFPGGGAYVGGPPQVNPGDLVTGTVSWAVVRGATNPPAAVVILPDHPGTPPRARPPLVISLTGVTITPNPNNPHPGDGYPWRSTSSGNPISVSRPGTLASLTATLTAPESVRVGRVLAYTVELTNHTDDPVSLERCPDVVQVLRALQKDPLSSGFRGPLNCAAAPRSIPAGGTVVFRMEVTTAGLVTGSSYLTWQLVSNGIAVSNLSTKITVLP